MNERIEKVKKHLKKHKVGYSCGVTVVIAAGITCIIMKSVKSSLDAGAYGSETTTLRSSFFSLYSKESGNNIVTTIHSGDRGHPGFRVKHLGLDIDFDTQGAAARAFHIPESILSKHLNGKLDDAYGEKFERILAA